MKTIKVTIAPDGAVKVETSGFAGRSCYDASGPIEDALGVRSENVETSEFYNVAAGDMTTRNDA